MTMQLAFVKLSLVLEGEKDATQQRTPYMSFKKKQYQQFYSHHDVSNIKVGPAVLVECTDVQTIIHAGRDRCDFRYKSIVQANTEYDFSKIQFKKGKEGG